MEKSIEFLQDMFPIDHQIIYDTYLSKKENLDETISSLISICSFGTKYPPTYEEAMLIPSTSISINNVENSKLKDSRRNLGKKEWRPPLIGKLSDDFLRVSNEISNNSASVGFICKSCSKLQFKNSTNQSNSSLIGSPYSTMTASEIENMDSIIRRRMEDNVSQMRCATMKSKPNIDNIKYLDDERLALMLQNQEFLKIVQSDHEFQQALREDRKAAHRSELDCDDIDEIWQERDESIRFNPQDTEFDYGYEQSDINDPEHLWTDHNLSNPENDVTGMCKSMGKASRNRFNSLAKKFFSIRRRKSSKSYANFNSVNEKDDKSNFDRWESESTQQLITPENDSDNWMDFTQNYSNSVATMHRTDSNTTLI